MNIQQQRTVQIEASKEELCRRTKTWAAKSEFILESESDNESVFTRGSHWHAIYTFDVRKMPTRVSIRISGQSPP